jgi:hypothetical protein
MCRVWIDGVPPGRQPAPTDCATARRTAPANARIVYGDDRSFPERGRGATGRTRTSNGDVTADPRACGAGATNGTLGGIILGGGRTTACTPRDGRTDRNGNVVRDDRRDDRTYGRDREDDDDDDRGHGKAKHQKREKREKHGKGDEHGRSDD